MKTFKNNREKYLFLINKFIKPEILLVPDRHFWPRETKIAGEILKQHSFEFLYDLELDFKLNSLAYFKSFDGIKLLNKKKNIDQKLDLGYTKNSGNLSALEFVD